MQRLGRPVRLLAWGAVAAALMCAVLALASHVVMPKNNQAAFGQIDAAANGVLGERADSLDVLFVGDSETYHSFSPLQMWGERGIASYVCATSAQRLPYTRTLLCRALTRQRPRIVVLETHCIFAGFDGEDEALRALKDLFPVFEYHNRWKSLTPGDITGSVRFTWTDPLKGFTLKSATEVRAADASGYMAPSSELEDLPARNRRVLEDIKAICDAHGAKLVLVSTPSTVNWSMPKHNRMVAVARELGVDYWDLNTGDTKVDIDWQTETCDGGDHLNLSGAQKVSSRMAALLSETYRVPDHREDDAYSDWDEAYTSYGRQLAALA